MEFFATQPTTRTILPTIQTFDEAQKEARAFLAHGSGKMTDAVDVIDLLASVLLCWPAAIAAPMTVGDVFRLLDSTVTADAERAQLLAVTPAGPARDILAGVNGLIRGGLRMAVGDALNYSRPQRQENQIMDMADARARAAHLIDGPTTETDHFWAQFPRQVLAAILAVAPEADVMAILADDARLVTILADTPHMDGLAGDQTLRRSVAAIVAAAFRQAGLAA